MSSRDDFNWEDNDAVTLRSYGSIAVYENPHGSVVVRQEGGPLEDGDAVVIIPLHDADLIASEILAVAKAARGATPDDDPPTPGRQIRLALPPPVPQQPDLARRDKNAA